MALGRASERRTLSAEKISTLSSLVDPNVRPDRETLHRLWDNIVLFDEHTWGDLGSVTTPESEQSVRQLAAKDAFATQAKAELEHALRRGMAAIADAIDAASGTWVVFNPLSWRRSGWVEMDLPQGQAIEDVASKQVMPYEVLSSQPTATSALWRGTCPPSGIAATSSRRPSCHRPRPK